jgi:hypothetical protein
VVVLVFGMTLFTGAFEYNSNTTWQVYQPVRGTAQIIDKAGWYYKGYGEVTTWPRVLEVSYLAPTNGSEARDESIKTTFNDGGTAQVSAYARVKLTTDAALRMKLHQDFQGNPENLKPAIGAHLANCVTASGPVMSASENQASRKGEFNWMCEEQLTQGLFKMRRTKIELDDIVELADAGLDAKGNKVTKEKKAVVQATEVVNDKDGNPIVIQPSPLLEYDFKVTQFSILDLDYDPQTQAQFAAKKESYLNAEQSKAKLQEEVQQALMIREKGLRQIAEIQAAENQVKEKAVIQAEKEQEVAVINKNRAVTEAQKKVEVAEQDRQEALKLQQIAEIKAKTAEMDKLAAISAAEAKQKTIELGGGISEEKRILAEYEMKTRVGEAQAWSQRPMPTNVIVGGGEGGGVLEQLISMSLMKHNGLMPATK